MEILSLVVSTISVLVAIIALLRSRKADEANKKYQEVREELAKLELIRLTQKANIQVIFSVQHITFYTRNYRGGGSGTGFDSIPESKDTNFLVIKNIGNVEAQNIELDFSSASEKFQTPRYLEDIKPIPILASGIEVSFPISLVLGDARELRGKWKWENPDGTKEERESYLIIP